RVNEAEDRRVGPNPEREREHGHRREARTLAQSPQSVAEILHHVFNPPHASRIAALLLSLFNASESAQRGVSRLFRRHAFGDVFFDLPIEVIAEFFVEFLLDLAAAEDRSQAQRY